MFSVLIYEAIIDSVSGSRYYSRLMEKIKTGSSSYIGGSESILIDLSLWDKDSLSPKIEMIQAAIEERKVLSFQYYAPGGESVRKLEPYFLIFKWSSWYVYGYCLLREDFRMFKLNRMNQLAVEAGFEKRKTVPMPDLTSERIFPVKTKVKAVFDASMKWHLTEEFGIDSFSMQPDGSLLFEREYSDDEKLISWMLSCRNRVTVIEPEHIREQLGQIASDIVEKYKKEG